MADLSNRKALLGALGADEEDPLAVPGATGIAAGEGAPNAGPAPVLDPPLGVPDAAADAPKPQTWSPGANAGKNSGMILGYDTGKLDDPSYQKGTKYNAAVRAFSGGLKQDVGVSRGGLGNMNEYLKANGFPNAQVVGDDKIDFGDGGGPIDVIRSDGQIVFQDPRGAINSGGGGSSDGGGGGDVSGLPSQLQGDPLAMIQQALAQYGQSPNLQALLAQLGGG